VPIEQTQVRNERPFAPGYVYREVYCPAPSGDLGVWLSTVVEDRPNGGHIDPKTADYLINTRGIKPTLRKPELSTCTIGYCERAGKWYGWSHRAIQGFGIGYKVGARSSVRTDKTPKGFIAKTPEDCRLLADIFAESVS
jgi:hypothetical protein